MTTQEDDSASTIPLHRSLRGRLLAAFVFVALVSVGGLGLVAYTNERVALEVRLVIAGASLLVAGLISLALSRTLTRPLAQLVQGTRAVAAGDWQAEINVAREDEIGLLADSFQAMVASLEKRQRQLEEANQVIRRAAEELSVAGDVLRSLNATPDVIQAFPVVAAGLRPTLGCQGMELSLLEENQAWFTVVAQDPATSVFQPGRRIPVADLAAGRDVVGGRLHLASNLADEKVRPIDQLLYDAGFRSRVYLPLRLEGRIIGMLSVGWFRPDGYSQHHLSLLGQIAGALALAVERSRLFGQAQRRANELEALAELSSALRKAGSVIEMLPVLLEKAIEVVGGRSGIIFLLEPESGELVARDCLPRDPNSLGMRHRLGEGITGRVAATGRIHVTEDVNEVSLVGLLPGEAKRFSMSRSAISLPLITQEQNVGVMHLELPEPHKFSEEEVRLLTAMAEMAGSALHRAGILETLEQRVAERTQELAGANQRLQELDRLKSQFVSNVTHELRAPVSNMILYLDLLAHGQPERREKYQAVLQEQASRLGQLIEDILSLSLLETGQEKAGLAPVSLSEVVEQVVTTHLPRAEKARLALNYELDPDVPLVEGERSQLARVVTNLVANAINYTLRGSIEVRLIYDPERGEARLEVEDTGIGIDAEDWPYLFDRFYRGQRARQMDIPGTGLGLGIVKEIVELHGGRIEFQSEVDVGTTFCVFFPVILFPLPAAESFVAAD